MLASWTGADVCPVELADSVPCLEGASQHDFAEVRLDELSRPADGTPEDQPLACCPDPKDLPPGSGTLEEPHETVEMAESVEGPGPVDTAEVPEGIEFHLAGEDGQDGAGEGEEVSPIPVPLPQPGDVITGADIRLVEEDDGMVDGSELSEASDEDDDDGEEATPINLPGPVPTIAEAPEPGPHPFPHTAMEEDDYNQVALDHPGTGGSVAQDGSVVEMPGGVEFQPASEDDGEGQTGAKVSTPMIPLPPPEQEGVAGTPVPIPTP